MCSDHIRNADKLLWRHEYIGNVHTHINAYNNDIWLITLIFMKTRKKEKTHPVDILILYYKMYEEIINGYINKYLSFIF